MSQWGQGQPGFQYPMQTGFPGQNPAFQQQGFPSGGLAPQPNGFPGQRPSAFQQPQQTGFPGAGPGLIPQQTGFPGMAGGFNQQQQRPPIPPVPPMPPQFQQQLPQTTGFLGAPQQPGRFLSPSPALGGLGLAPQPTGFPGPGGLQPLLPQQTGFIDPRLQMMSSTFLPANQLAPYNAAGAPQLLQPQQQLGGLSLQQSFQQHNQEMKGTAAPRVPWALSKGEKKSYDQIFRAWDQSGSGFIDGKTAIEVFGQSGLDRNDLARIWTLADADNRGKLNMAEFHVAMGLIYRKLNGNEIPDELPAELVPPSHRDLDTSINFLKDVLKNDARARSPSSLDVPVSRMKVRSINSTSAPGAGGRQDATVYKHTDSQPPGGYYTPASRHIDRSAVRTDRERESPASDLSDMKRQLENTAKMLDRAAEDSVSRTAEDEALDREMSDLRWRVKRVQEDLDYFSRGPRSARSDEERRKLERELLQLMHEHIPEVERKIQDREERKQREKREWDRQRDVRNERFGRFDDGERDYRSYSRSENRDDYDRYDRDRDRDRDYGRDRSYRDRSRSRDRTREYDRPRDYDRPRSPPAARSPPPPPPPAAPENSISKPPPPPPAPTASPAASTKNMTPEKRKAFIREQAERRMAERMAALGVAPPGSTRSKLDTSVEDRLAREKKEAEEKTREAEKAAEEREKARRERLEGEKALKEGKTPPTPAPPTSVTVKPAAPPPPKPRAPAPPPPRKAAAPRLPVTPRAAAPPPAPPAPAPAPPAPAPPPPAPAKLEIDPEEERLRAREEALRKQREERLARFRQLELEEEEERKREEELLKRKQEEAAKKAKDDEERRKKEEREARIRQMEMEEAEEQRKAEEEFARRREARSRASTPAPSAPAPAPAPPVPALPPPVAAPSFEAPPPPPPPAPPALMLPVTSTASDKGKYNPFSRLVSAGGVSSPSSAPAMNGGSTNPFFKSQPAVTSPPGCASSA